MIASIFDYFFDPVLRAPMIGSMLMCVAASMVGVTVFLKKQSLIGETLSHAAYPGVVIGMTLLGLLSGDDSQNSKISLFMLIGAFLTSLLGMGCMHFLQNKVRVYPDAALCFVLSYFFGVGILIASIIQFPFSNLYRQVQTYFYGQVVTLTDQHIYLYGALAAVIALLLSLFRKEFKAWLFDVNFAKISGIPVKVLQWFYLFLITLSIAIGIRTVGVVLMSAMLIAPAVAARQLTNSLKMLFIFAAIFGLLSAGLGTYFANELSIHLAAQYPGLRMSIPLGPAIILVASTICILALLFSPERGAVTRAFRVIRFRKNCLRENILKTIWRLGPSTRNQLQEHLFVPHFYLNWTLFRLRKEGWIIKHKDLHSLTKEGDVRSKHIIRLHRLWELYLADYIGIGASRVHASAEEMEHILTPELEIQLIEILRNPAQDPHHQPIPPLKEGTKKS